MELNYQGIRSCFNVFSSIIFQFIKPELKLYQCRFLLKKNQYCGLGKAHGQPHALSPNPLHEHATSSHYKNSTLHFSQFSLSLSSRKLSSNTLFCSLTLEKFQPRNPNKSSSFWSLRNSIIIIQEVRTTTSIFTSFQAL